MPQDAKRRQKALQKHTAKRKQKHAVMQRQAPPSSIAPVMREAAGWPLHECLITAEWRNPQEITQIVVARRAPSGEVVCGVFLVDLACLGVKNVIASEFGSVAQYETQLLDRLKRDLEFGAAFRQRRCCA